MKARTLPGIATSILMIGQSQACGPFFPDTVLNQPQAALAVPPVSYLHELYQLLERPMPETTEPTGGDTSPFLAQIPLESAELRSFWEASGVGAVEINRRIEIYRSVRQQLLAPVKEVSRMDFPTAGDTPAALPERPLGDDFPPDVADYVEAARLWSVGEKGEARTLWKQLLDRPAAGKRHRAMWAAWMLAKTSADAAECQAWYERVEAEAELGASDAIGLRGAAKSWRASMVSDPVQSIHLLWDALLEGKADAAIDLRNASGRILAKRDPAVLATAAADPVVRRLVNLHLQVSLDGPRAIPTTEIGTPGFSYPPDEWLAALEANAPRPLDDGTRVAWALYSAGRFEEARKWLGISVQDNAPGHWLRAKFDLRDGNLESAKKHLAAARSDADMANDWNPENLAEGFRWSNSGKEIRRATQGRLSADIGVLDLATQDYLDALENLRHAGYSMDAAYLSEQLISTDGLIRHVRKAAPHPQADEDNTIAEQETIDPFSCLTTGRFHAGGMPPDNRLRYQLARRLAREYRLKEAREFMPPELLPLLEHYIALDRARRAERYSGEALAAVIWRQALIHRHLGAELFSTDGAPDGGLYGWNYPVSNVADMRKFRDGWSFTWDGEPSVGPPARESDRSIPRITSDEVRRIRQSGANNLHRFQYRYRAAELAWQAARTLPANHPLLPGIYNTAGLWLANRDPKAADRFYQAMVRRCAKTPEGQAADEKRWFLSDIPSLDDLPSLPAEFKNTSANPASR